MIILLVCPSRSHAGAWLQEPGTAYLRLSAGYLSTDQRYDENGNVIPFDNAGGGTRDTRFKDGSFTLYSEWGVHPNWNLLGDVTWKYVEAVQPSATFKTWGAGDVRAGIKRRLYRGTSTVMAMGVLVVIPTGYDPDEYPALGSGVWELGGLFQIGGSGTGYWWNTDALFRWRGEPFRPLIELAVNGGTGIGDRLGLRFEARGGMPIGASNISNEDFRFDPVTVDPTWVDLSGTVAFDLKNGLALEAEVRGTVHGENTLKGTRFTLAVATQPAWRFKP